jgi:hypothetical protein
MEASPQRDTDRLFKGLLPEDFDSFWAGKRIVENRSANIKINLFTTFITGSW